MNSQSITFFAFTLILIIQVSCKPSLEDPPLFKDLTAEDTGIRFSNSLMYSEEFNIIDFLYYYDGGGVAIGDINNDGLSDIYLVSNEGDNGLFLNLGEMKFQDITNSAGVGSPGLWKSGVSMVDINGDGLLDIYQCRLGNYKNITGQNELYVNQGDLTFKEEAAKYNLAFSGYSTQAAFFDMDNDDDLDAYLLNHSVHTERSFGAAQLRMEVDTLAGDRILRNDNNYFTDITGETGIYQSQIGYGLGIGLSDINGDGFVDIFISNDFTENDYLYLNNQNGTFKEVFSEMADQSSLSSMGNDLADFNNDGLTDILTLDMLPADEFTRKSTVGEDPDKIFRMKMDMGYMPQYKRNTLQLNRGDGTFSDIAMMAGIYATDWSWAPLFADLDNDGWKDLFISNGIPGRPNDLDYIEFIEKEEIKNNPDIPDSVIYQKMPPGYVANYFFKNNGDLTFQDFSSEWGVVKGRITNGIAYSDLDNDGDLDLVLNNLDAEAVIKENTSNKDSTNHFLSVELIGKTGNTQAIGAKVEIFSNNNSQYFELYPVRGFKSSVDPRIHIGLGEANSIDSLRILWPGGDRTVLYDIEANNFLKISQKDDLLKNSSLTLEMNEPNFISISNEELGIEYKHQENRFIEFSREPLIPHMHSREGPALAVSDINGDGLDDFYIGGAKHQAGQLYIQTNSRFSLTKQIAFEDDKLKEDVDAAFLDFDLDGDQDLVVVSGGNEFDGHSPNLQPRLYLNDGAGIFSRLIDAFEGAFQTGSCLAIYDFNEDGWEDIFFGSQVVPWNYGEIPQSYLFKNDSGHSFINVTNYLPDNGFLGMINDAKWIDLEGTGNKSLVIAGEWMEMKILHYQDEGFNPITIEGSSGMWKTIDHIDIDADGDQDLIAGNMGLNSKLKASRNNPLNLYLKDFDRNGKMDPVITTTINGIESVFTSKENLIMQIPSIGLRFPTSKMYAEASLEDILEKELENATKYQITELRSGLFMNNEANFQFEPFPNIMQISFIQDFLVGDLSGDNFKEIIPIGNLYPASMQEGRYAAGRGMIFRKENNQILKGNLGALLKGDYRFIESINLGGKDLIIITANDDSIRWLMKNIPDF